jgi:glycosyltransferase involved in cell wall biosynthesis
LSSRLPTIAHVDAERGFSGGEMQVFLLMEGLRARGWGNVLICPPESAGAVRARESGFSLRPREMRNTLDLPSVLGLARDLRSCGAALVHLHTSRAHWLGGLAARLAGLPAVATRRMDKPLKRSLRSRFMYTSLVQRTAAISAAVERQLIEGGVPPASIVRVEDAVDPSALQPRRTREAVRAELGAGQGERVLLSLGGLVERKGHDLTLRALALLAHRGLDARLWIAGEGSQRSELEALRDELGLGNRLSLLGQRTDGPDLLGACDVFVMPSRAEGLGVAALEAMACARPVVATRVGGLADAVVHEGTGLLIEAPEAGELAAALARLLEDPALCARLGSAGPARIAQRYHADQMLARYELLYREVLAAAGRPLEALSA